MVDEDNTDGAWSWVRRVVVWLVLLAAVAVLAVAVIVPRIAGATPYAVQTGSMQPTYPPGTLVVTRPVDNDEIGIGTPLTYQLESGESTVVTHRVVGVRLGDDGKSWFQTQGDANNAPDEDLVRPIQVRGEVWYDVPYLGYLNSVLNGAQHQLLVFVVAGGLVVYALFMFVSALRDRVRAREAARAADTVGRHREVSP